MAFKSYRQESKSDWGTSDTNLTIEQINAGSLLRIADATEKMASNYVRMEADLKWYKEKYDSHQAEIKRLNRVINGLRGHIKRIKK